VVDCAEAEQVRRVMVRSKLTAAEVAAIMAAQVDRATRLAAADDVIDNSGPPSDLHPQILALDRRYRQLANQKAHG
jgi:dephospho-CoA kinase